MTELSSAPLLRRPREAARMIGCGMTNLYALIKEGRLDSRKLGRATVITQESIERLVAGLPPANPRS